MAIQRLRVWQWVLISLFTGGVLGFVWTSSTDVSDAGSTWGLGQFVNVLRMRTDKGDPVLTNIVIHPLITDAQGKKVQRVYFSVKGRNKTTGNWDPVEHASVVAPVPAFAVSDNKDYRLQDYLQEEQKNGFKELTYKYAWWKVSGLRADQLAAGDRELSWWQKPRNAWVLTMAASVLLIGVMWPIAIQAMIKMGLVPAPEAPEVDLSKVRNSPTKAQAKGPRVTSDDLTSLDALNAKLEENVAGMLLNADERDDVEERRAEAAVIKKLSNEPAEQQSTGAAPEENKEYQGEWYPVVKPHSDDAPKKK
ncbi:MAG: hypothetical protein H7144_15370 [Burkholderiales bacterium]|nr:hypothetical protein [Phycisphaerae bacterium]